MLPPIKRGWEPAEINLTAAYNAKILIGVEVMDFSKPETRELYERTVRERQELLGCSRAQAEMLVAALMWEGSHASYSGVPRRRGASAGKNATLPVAFFANDGCHCRKLNPASKARPIGPGSCAQGG